MLNFLKNHIEEIEALNPGIQSVHYHGYWVNYFAHPEINESIVKINAHYPGNVGISRQDIIDYLGQQDATLLRGFLMSQIWGSGFIPGQQQADNRGHWRTSHALHNLDFALNQLNLVNELLQGGDIFRAHELFEPLPRIRVNYFSKFLYFLGRSLNVNEYPLIFDSRVSKKIRMHADVNDVIFYVVQNDGNPKQDAHSYQQYCTQMHHYSEQLGNVGADKIEYFLWNFQPAM